MTVGDRLLVADDVASALAEGRPVVALESTLISHGLPYPQNVEVARAAEAAVRESGAAPATIAIRRDVAPTAALQRGALLGNRTALRHLSAAPAELLLG